MRRVFVANRGEIAVRIVRACFDEGLESVVAVSEPDRASLAAARADRAVCIGPASPEDSYLSVDRVMAAAVGAGCDALHPGYGFLSERPELAEACRENGIAFVGPTPETISRAGDKMLAREVARSVGVPVSGGSEGVSSHAEAAARAAETGFPLIIKAAAGGGGRGMVLVYDEESLESKLALASREAERAFGDGRVFVERFVEHARHVEVQILADTHGTVCHLGTRDCSLQRRYQKVVEEGPAPGLPIDLLDQVQAAAVRIAEALDYVGAGTVEFLVDVARETFLFLEVNTRVQVEHPVSEMITGIDIVREQLRIADGAPLSFSQADVRITGHAIECRINAEDVAADFRPSPGRITAWTEPAGAGVRVDTHCSAGVVVSPFYDSLLAKLIVHAPDRDAAVRLAQRALSTFRVEGVETTIDLHGRLMRNDDFINGDVSTRWLETTFLT